MVSKLYDLKMENWIKTICFRHAMSLKRNTKQYELSDQILTTQSIFR